MEFKNFHFPQINSITPQDGVLKERIESGRTGTIPASLAKSYETGRIDAFKLNWKKGDPDQPHFFWDSDVAKVLEGIANSLSLHPDKELEAEYDKIIDLIASAQQPDGYLNVYFTVVEPEQRWKKISETHELYCAGHLLEAAVAGYTLLGKRKFLDVMCRYIDYIDTVFGAEEGKLRGYPGHQELELALIRLYEVTGNKKYADLSKFFIDERGKEPHFYRDIQKHEPVYGLIEVQSHKPVREETKAVGHSVRAVYMYSAMADQARIYNDEELFNVCEKIYRNITGKRMYITGGIGSTFHGEAFTTDYDLSNGTSMYAESCAAIGLVRFAGRMFNITGDGKYVDTVERAIFNGILSGISLDGKKYFYTNYLEMDENYFPYNMGASERQPWFWCSCCPTNFCRFLPEMLQYCWSESDDEVTLNIPAATTFKSRFGEIGVQSLYPYDGAVSVTVNADGKFKLSCRIPNWCKGATFLLNGEKQEIGAQNGFVTFDREWKKGDKIEYMLPMPVEVMRSNSKVTGNNGRIALMRGPLVYACETVDNPQGVANMIIPAEQEFKLAEAAGLPAGTVAITGEALYESKSEELYSSEPPTLTNGKFTAIPYALWQNRGKANMAVWIREK
ncbi:MAG: glycoside hydrolase family 127 protein [Lentisphaeria bacterium]|nr:glycoside hydrolase family 127 protein [Lentisphaeria bacterium]